MKRDNEKSKGKVKINRENEREGKNFFKMREKKKFEQKRS